MATYTIKWLLVGYLFCALVPLALLLIYNDKVNDINHFGIFKMQTKCMQILKTALILYLLEAGLPYDKINQN